jgi:ABC-type transporter Mla subunit MlaD
MRTRHLNGLLIAILLISTAPLYAQGQEQNVAKLKADARNVVGIIGSDKTKTQTYCQILDLTGQLDRANQEKDSKKTRALSQKVYEVQKQLGPEFVALIKGLNRINLNSRDGREILSIIGTLDQSCPD